MAYTSNGVMGRCGQQTVAYGIGLNPGCRDCRRKHEMSLQVYILNLITRVEQAVWQGGRMALQISMQGDENRSLPSHIFSA